VRLVGGNTGPGAYKDWPVDIDVLIGTTGVKELTGITNREVCSNTLCICSGSSHVLLLIVADGGACYSFYSLCNKYPCATMNQQNSFAQKIACQ